MNQKKSFFSRHKRTLIVLGVVLAIVVIIIANLGTKREKTLKVTIEKAARRDLTSIITASGEIKPKKNINISALVPGRIAKIGVIEGQEVKAGDFLLQLESTQYEANADRDRGTINQLKAALIRSEAILNRDKNSYNRLKKLFDDQLVSREQMEAAKAQFDVSKADLNALQFQIRQAEASLKGTLDNLNKTIYTSPIDGIITSLRVEEGEVAIIGTMNNAGTVLLSIADLSVMEVEVEVDETDVIGAKLGQEANIRVDAFPGTVFKGKLTEIGSSALQKTVTTSEESRDFKVVITLENPPYRLKPGLSASADIILAEKKDALSVPISALVIKEKDKREEEGIYIVDAGRVKFQPVSKGITGGMYIEISEGLKVGQEFVSGPYAALRDLKDGILVKAAPAVPAGKAAKSK